MSEEVIDFEENLVDEHELVEEPMMAKRQLNGCGRQLVEEKLEELRMQRMTQDYDFS